MINKMQKSTILTFLVFLGMLTIGALADPNTDQKRSVGNGMGFVIGGECRKKSKGTCQPLQFTTCFGVKLPYAMTSPDLVNENYTQQQLHNEMSRWEGLRAAPKCWDRIQTLLCSFYFPKCQDDMIDLPSQELCKIARHQCGIIEEATRQWPEFLKCNELSFPSGCKSELHPSKFNSSGKCMDPMKEVENNFNYYEGFEGCAIKCQDPLYTEEDHNTTSTWIWYLGVITALCNGWVVLTFVVEGMASSQYPKYPSAIILYVNAWYLVATIGWLFQYLPLAKEDIVCRKDGTVRRNEITGTESMFCALVSSWIYVSIMSALAWLMVFAYVFHLTCNAVGRVKSKIDKQRAYYIVWTILFPISLLVVCLSVAKMDGSSIYGICFVGFFEPVPRILLVFLPVGLASAVILFYLFRGARTLLSVSITSSNITAGRAELNSSAFRIITFSVLMFGLLVAVLVMQVISILKQPELEKSFRESMLCKVNLTDIAECGAHEKPDLNIVIGNLIAFFGGGIIVSSLAWTSSSINIWRRSLKVLCRSQDAEVPQSRMQKHKLIVKAYGRRHDLPAKGRLSLSLYSTHEDPIGLNKLLDPNHICRNGDDAEHAQQYSNATGDGSEISSDWAAAIPNIINRRGALIPPHSSNSVSCVSEDSRRPSCDSAMSELAVRNLQGSSRRFKKSRRFFKFRSRSSNRGSSTSLESNPGSQILPAITKLIDKREQMGDDNIIPNNQLFRPGQTKIVRESAIQTSLEKLYTPSKGIKQCNLSNNLCVDKATQSSLVSLHEIGTQTKKSATKKRDKKKKDSADGKDHLENIKSGQEDLVRELLTPKK